MNNPLATVNRIALSYYRVPLGSKLILAVAALFFVLGFSNSFKQWALLDPTKVFAGGAHRLSTYPFMHLGFYHLLVNVVAIIPLLDKFEREYGTLTTLALFFGPFTTFPGILYSLICLVFGFTSPVGGASVWAMLLFSSTIFQASRATPDVAIPSTTYRLPTLAIPFVLILLTAILVPHTSILGHLCGMAMGFGWGAGYLKFLIPPAKYLRWIEDKLMLRTRLSSSYVDVSLDRQSSGGWGSGILPMSGEPIDLEHNGGNSGIRLGP